MKDPKDMQEQNRTSDDSWKRYFQLGEVPAYFRRLFGRKDTNAPANVNLRMMHGINKISIIMFAIAVVVMVVRFMMR